MFENVKGKISKFFLRSEYEMPQSGVYHFRRGDEEHPSNQTRIHLRIDADASGVLLVNANRILHLNPTASFLAYLILHDVPENEILEAMVHHFRVSRSQARQDYSEFSRQITDLIRPDGPCPICEMELDTLPPFSARPSAPYRMDLALTYRCNNTCSHCYNARPRSFPEMETDQWKQIIDRVWERGIPHVVFTGGEPTLRNDLPQLIAQAERNGQITGLNTNGRRLSDPAYLQSLVDAGLDHVQITLESHSAETHDSLVKSQGAWKQTVAGIEQVLKSRLYVMTNTTLLQQNSPALAETLAFLTDLGVPTVGLNALIYSGRGLTVGTGLPEEALPPLLTLARSHTEANHQKLIWYTPTEYCHFDPVQLNLGVKGCTAAFYNMCIEPDGAVIPCQSYYEPLGNMLTDPWEKLWNHPLALSLRERKDVPFACRACEILQECGGGCPLARSAVNAIPVPIQTSQVF